MEEKPKPSSRRSFVKAAIVGGATAAVIGTAVLGPSLRPSAASPGPASFPQVGSHLVWFDKGANLFRRRNLITGTDEFSQGDGAAVVQSAIDSLPSDTGGIIWVTEDLDATDGVVTIGKDSVSLVALRDPPPRYWNIPRPHIQKIQYTGNVRGGLLQGLHCRELQFDGTGNQQMMVLRDISMHPTAQPNQQGLRFLGSAGYMQYIEIQNLKVALSGTGADYAAIEPASGAGACWFILTIGELAISDEIGKTVTLIDNGNTRWMSREQFLRVNGGYKGGVGRVALGNLNPHEYFRVYLGNISGVTPFGKLATRFFESTPMSFVGAGGPTVAPTTGEYVVATTPVVVVSTDLWSLKDSAGNLIETVPATQALVPQARQEGRLLRDDLLEIGPERVHRWDLVEIFLPHRRVCGRTLRRHVQPAVMDGEDVVEDVLHRTMRRLAILDQLLAGQFREGFAVVAQDLPVVLVDGSEVRRRGHVVAYHRGNHKGFRGGARIRVFADRKS